MCEDAFERVFVAREVVVSGICRDIELSAVDLLVSGKYLFTVVARDLLCTEEKVGKSGGELHIGLGVVFRRFLCRGIGTLCRTLCRPPCRLIGRGTRRIAGGNIGGFVARIVCRFVGRTVGHLVILLVIFGTTRHKYGDKYQRNTKKDGNKFFHSYHLSL